MKIKELKNQLPAAPEYLAQILLIERDKGVVPNARLADRLGVSRPAVSQAIGRLKKLGLVIQDRYGDISLSRSGLSIAQSVVRRHFLLEHLLVNVLEYPWDTSDVEAGNLQDSLSDELTEYLDQFLNWPQTCPHGNPMPKSKIEKQYLRAPKLSDASEGSKIRIIRITEEGELAPGLLSFCMKHSLMPGKELIVSGQTESKTKCSMDSNDVDVVNRYAQFILWEKA